MSRTIKFAKAGGPEVLEFLETDVPAPGPTEVRIKVKAIGIISRRVDVAHRRVHRASGEVPGGSGV
jgi:NADPH:quinone reductase-like Zn-dependent oxidoreductase